MSLSASKLPLLKKLSLSQTKIGATGSLTTLSKTSIPDGGDLARMIAKNPTISKLVKTLDLIEPGTRETPLAIIKPYLNRMEKLAEKILEAETSYTKAQIIERLGQKINSNGVRSSRGFAVMLQAGIIKPGKGDCYYLVRSTPF